MRHWRRKNKERIPVPPSKYGRGHGRSFLKHPAGKASERIPGGPGNPGGKRTADASLRRKCFDLVLKKIKLRFRLWMGS
jgi:hypothetical protein